MSFFVVSAVFINVAAFIRRHPLLVGATYLTQSQGVEIGPLHFTAIRLLVVFGAIRVMLRKERIEGGLQKLDWLVLVWGVVVVLSGLFHQDIGSAVVLRLGMCYDGLGIYFLLRVFIYGEEPVLRFAKMVMVTLVPVAIEMAIESVTGHNSFSVLGGVFSESEFRNGHFRAQGPFSHSILAGTVGAVSWPLLLPYWRRQKALAMLGVVACIGIVFTSRSSGPISSGLVVFGGLCIWRVRHYMGAIRWGGLWTVIALQIVMTAPVYYLVARIDFTGSSTGLHRAALIQSAIEHIGEWWLAGTDYTRHWMSTGVDWSPDHSDITNHYIKMGVIGGLPLMIAFMATLVEGFVVVRKTLRLSRRAKFEVRYMVWTMGAILFGHALTFISVSYFDQSMAFYLAILAGIAAGYSESKSRIRTAKIAANLCTV